MKVLLIHSGLPGPNGADYVGKYSANALRSLGHEVIELGGFYRVSDVHRDMDCAEDIAWQEKPDFILHVYGIAYPRMKKDILYALSKTGIPTVLWVHNEEMDFHETIKISSKYTLFCSYTKLTLGLHKKAGANAMFLPLAADPGIFFPMEISDKDREKYDYECAIAGWPHPVRVKIVKEIEKDFKTFTNWDMQLPEEELNNLYNTAKIMLSPYQDCDQLKSALLLQELERPLYRAAGCPCRTYEVPAAQAFQLQVDREDLADVYDIEKEIALSDGFEESFEKGVSQLKKRIEYFLIHEEERKKIAIASYTRTMASNLYTHRMQAIIDRLTIDSLWNKEAKVSRKKSKKKPLVSVITLAYNCEKYIGACIESVLQQTLSDWEMIILDDGSTDNTYDVVSQYKDPRIRYFYQEHLGIREIGAAYNKALSYSKGDLISILEADDFIPRYKLEKLIKGFDNPSVVLAYGVTVSTNANGSIRDVLRIPLESAARFNKPIGEAVGCLLRGDGLFTFPCSTIIRKKSLLEIGGFIQPGYLLLVDLPTFLNIAMKGEFYFVNQVMGFWRRHNMSISTRNPLIISMGNYKYSIEFYQQHRDKLNLSLQELREIEISWKKRIDADYYNLLPLGCSESEEVTDFVPLGFFKDIMKSEFSCSERLNCQTNNELLSFNLLSDIINTTKNSIKDFNKHITSILQTHFILPFIIRMRKSALPLSLFSLPVPQKKKWRPAGKDILREEFKKEALPSHSRVLLLRGPEPGMVNDVYDVLKEIYPQAEVIIFIGDRREIEGFKGTVLQLPCHGRINYFFKLWPRIFKKFDLILILRKDAFLKKILALASFPRAGFTINNVGKLEKVGILNIFRKRL